MPARSGSTDRALRFHVRPAEHHLVKGTHFKGNMVEVSTVTFAVVEEQAVMEARTVAPHKSIAFFGPVAETKLQPAHIKVRGCLVSLLRQTIDHMPDADGADASPQAYSE